MGLEPLPSACLEGYQAGVCKGFQKEPACKHEVALEDRELQGNL